MEHSFDIEIAKKYGIPTAIILKHLYFWIEKNRANNKHYYDGYYWTYNSKKAFAELFPYMTERQVDYTLKKMIDSGLIIKGEYNKSAYDRTSWYALTDKGLATLQNCEIEESPTSQNCEVNKTKLFAQTDEIVRPIPDINTDNKTHIFKKENVKEKTQKTNPEKEGANESFASPTPETKKEKNIKHKYGQYQNVMLTDEEMDQIKKEYPNDYQEWIERVSEYIAATGKKYKNFVAVIRRWSKNNFKGEPNKALDIAANYDINDYETNTVDEYESYLSDMLHRT